MGSNSLIQDLVDLVNNFDPLSLLPDVTTMFGWVETFCRICVLASPAVMLFFGLWYLLLPPKEANRSAGWRFYFGMGSVEAWRFTQLIAGIVLSALGLILGIVMLLIAGSFREMDMMLMADKTVQCLLWELGAWVVCVIGIDITVLVMYNRKGDRRWQKNKAKKAPKKTKETKEK